MTGPLSGSSTRHRNVTGAVERGAHRARLVAQVPIEHPNPPRRSPVHIEPDDDTETSTFTAPLAPTEAVTEAIPTVAEVPPDGCRTLVNGVRCGHLKAAHLPSGYNEGQRCGCGCETYRMPWAEVSAVVGYALLWAVPLSVLIIYTTYLFLQLLVTGLTP